MRKKEEALPSSDTVQYLWAICSIQWPTLTLAKSMLRSQSDLYRCTSPQFYTGRCHLVRTINGQCFPAEWNGMELNGARMRAYGIVWIPEEADQRLPSWKQIASVLIHGNIYFYYHYSSLTSTANQQQQKKTCFTIFYGFLNQCPFFYLFQIIFC